MAFIAGWFIWFDSFACFDCLVWCCLLFADYLFVCVYLMVVIAVYLWLLFGLGVCLEWLLFVVCFWIMVVGVLGFGCGLFTLEWLLFGWLIHLLCIRCWWFSLFWWFCVFNRWVLLDVLVFIVIGLVRSLVLLLTFLFWLCYGLVCLWFGLLLGG